MRNWLYRRLVQDAVKKLKGFAQEVSIFTRRCLSQKKIVVISDNKIISVPISTRIQSIIVSVIVVGMLWVSHATSKYVSYETILTEKENKLWTASVKNKDLQDQVKDLHENLKELRRYFASIRDFDQVAANGVSDKDSRETHADIQNVSSIALAQSDTKEKNKAMVGITARSEELKQERKVRHILKDIRTRIDERISSLEAIINMTGVSVDTLAKHDDQLGDALAQRDTVEDMSAQGGPFIPAEDGDVVGGDKFKSEIDYLLALEKVVHKFPLAAPLNHYYLSSRFGKRLDPIRRRMAVHKGLDLVGTYGDQVHASAPGKVVFAGRDGAYGRFVEIDHGSGISTRYGHLKEIKVTKGQQVARGDVIGFQGNSGRSTGSHLHYEVCLDGKQIDPYNFLKAGNHVFQKL